RVGKTTDHLGAWHVRHGLGRNESEARSLNEASVVQEIRGVSRLLAGAAPEEWCVRGIAGPRIDSWM
ncbi:MAG TPA: hypothetical protein PKI24_09410, partial [Nitrospira sp.]|nr:hypothetical protein [Nitrospira sp.]